MIDENGEQMGILPPFEALRIARERGLDLVRFRPTRFPRSAGFRTTAATFTRRKERARRPQEAEGDCGQRGQVLGDC